MPWTQAISVLNGNLCWLKILTRTNISFAIAVLSLQVHALNMRHMLLARKVLRYGTGTVNWSFTCHRSVQSSGRSICANSNASRGIRMETRKSTLWWIIAIHRAPAVWKTGKQMPMSSPSGKVDYTGMGDCVEQLRGVHLFREISNKKLVGRRRKGLKQQKSLQIVTLRFQ